VGIARSLGLVAALLLVGVVGLPGSFQPVATADPFPIVRNVTLPPGERLPDDAQCVWRVLPAEPEIRPTNAVFNYTRGQQPAPPGALLHRVTGNFTGTTDEIIQWASCKWGIDTEVVRAQAAQESSWFMTSVGDFTSDESRCAPGHPPGADGRPGCPESIGIMSVKYHYHSAAFPWAGWSTAYNLDYALGVWRTCFEGEESWIADHPPESGYGRGDLWGCVGRWYSGDWRSAEALEYIGKVQAYMDGRVWAEAWFAELRAATIVG